MSARVRLVLVAGRCGSCGAEWRCWTDRPDQAQPCPSCVSDDTTEVAVPDEAAA